MTDNQLRRIETAPAQLQAPAPVNVGEIIGEIMRKGVDPSAAASAIKELVHLQNDQEDRWAKRSWTQAFSAARAKCKTIQAEKAVELQGKVAFHYAPLPDLMDAIEPICEPLGLSISFDSAREGTIVTGVCIVYHDGGHSERRSCAMTIANAKGLIPDMGAITTTQRKALCLMFGLKTRHMDETDPRIMGDLITPEEAEELERRCAALGQERYTKMLLKYLGAQTFSDVYGSRLADARRALMQAETKAKANPSPQGGTAAPRNVPPSQTTAADGSNHPAAADTPKAPQPSAPVQTSPAQTGREHAPSMGVQEAEGGGGGGVLPRASEIAPPSPPDAFEHWRTMTPADTRATWEAMNGDARTKAWAQMPKDVRTVVRAKLESTTK